MEMPFDKLNTIQLILKTYSQFSEPLFHLYKLSAKSDISEAKKVQEVYKSYLDSIGAVDEEREPNIKIQENVEPELYNASYRELLEILLECKRLAEAYKLKVKDEIPIESVIEKTIKEATICEFGRNFKQEVSNINPSIGNNTPSIFNYNKPELVLLNVPLDNPYIAVTREQHRGRNIYQKQYAPPNRFIAEAMRRIGLFNCVGSTLTHNLPEGDDTPEKREDASKDISGIFGLKENFDYRGSGRIFKGMQFIYKQPERYGLQTIKNEDLLEEINNEDNIDIIIDPVNIGTYDYFPPPDFVRHEKYDVNPWIRWGNDLYSYNKSDVIMQDSVLKKIKDIIKKYLEEKEEERDEGVAKNERYRNEIESILPTPIKHNVR